jgi:hypothetical protein
MNARRAVLGAADIDSRSVEMDLLPADIDQLTHPQGMPECHQDQHPIADWVAAVAGGGKQAIDLAFRQIFALPIFGVLCPTTANCRLFRLRGP